MNKSKSALYKTISAFMAKPYPFYYQGKSLWRISVVLFVLVLLFNYLLEPFEVYIPEHKMPFFWISVIHSTSCLVIIGLLSLYKVTLKTEENWTVKKEITLVVLFLLLVGITQFLIRDIIYNNPNNWSWRYFYEEIRNTFLIGSFLVILITSLNHNRLNSKHNKNAKALHLSKNEHTEAVQPIIEIQTQVQSDAFALTVDNLLFAKAEGNYVELYLNDAHATKLLKRLTLKELELALQEHRFIVKTHRSYIVNLHHLKSVGGNAQGYKLSLNNCHEKIPVARTMVQEFDAAIKRLRS